MIIRNRRRVAQQTAPQTVEADIDSVLLADLDVLNKPQAVAEPDPTPDLDDAPNLAVKPEEQPVGQEQPVNRRGRPRKDAVRPDAVTLPDSMSDALLAWACGIEPGSNSVYRWKTGRIALPDNAADMMRLFEVVGEAQFIEIVSKIRGTEPPVKAFLARYKQPVSTERYISEMLRDRGEAATVSEMHEALRTRYNHNITLDSFRVMLNRLHRKGVVVSETRGLWKLAKP